MALKVVPPYLEVRSHLGYTVKWGEDKIKSLHLSKEKGWPDDLSRLRVTTELNSGKVQTFPMTISGDQLDVVISFMKSRKVVSLPEDDEIPWNYL